MCDLWAGIVDVGEDVVEVVLQMTVKVLHLPASLKLELRGMKRVKRTLPAVWQLVLVQVSPGDAWLMTRCELGTRR